MNPDKNRKNVEQRAEVRLPVKLEITAKGRDVFGHEQLDAIIVDMSHSGAAIRASHPFEVNSTIDIYIAGEFAAKAEIVSVARDEAAEDANMKVRMGVEIVEKNEHWLKQISSHRK
jgi:hypothetical protein